MKSLISALIILSSVSAYGATDEFDRFFDDLIREQEREVESLREMRKEFTGKAREEKHTVSERFREIREELRDDFRKFSESMIHPKSSGQLTGMEVRENPGSYDVTVYVEGLKKGETTAEVRGNDLVVSGKSTRELTAGKAKGFETREIHQEIHLNEKVDPKSLKVNFTDGSMKIHLNKVQVL